MIDKKKLIEEIDLYIRCYSNPPYGREIEGTVELLKEVKDVLNNQSNADRWIPCSERLPENAKHKGSFCPRYQVNTEYGVTEGWYNPNVESWYCLFWFLTGRCDENDIDFKRGDKPKIVKIPMKTGKVTAWQPLPEPWEEGN